jgi:hypothetical protein
MIQLGIGIGSITCRYLIDRYVLIVVANQYVEGDINTTRMTQFWSEKNLFWSFCLHGTPHLDTGFFKLPRDAVGGKGTVTPIIKLVGVLIPCPAFRCLEEFRRACLVVLTFLHPCNVLYH